MIRADQTLADLQEEERSTASEKTPYAAKPCIYCPEGRSWTPRNGMAAKHRKHCYLPEHELKWESDKYKRLQEAKKRRQGLDDAVATPVRSRSSVLLERLQRICAMMEEGSSEDLVELLEQLASSSREYGTQLLQLSERLQKIDKSSVTMSVRSILKQLDSALKDAAKDSNWVSRTSDDLVRSSALKK